MKKLTKDQKYYRKLKKMGKKISDLQIKQRKESSGDTSELQEKL